MVGSRDMVLFDVMKYVGAGDRMLDRCFKITGSVRLSPLNRKWKNSPTWIPKKRFYTACKRAGITDFRFHDLRHTFCSELVMKGLDLKTIAELLGHTTTRMTERYSHLSPNHKRFAIELLDSEKGYVYVTVKNKRPNSKVANISKLVDIPAKIPFGSVVERSNAPDCKSGGLRPT